MTRSKIGTFIKRFGKTELYTELSNAERIKMDLQLSKLSNMFFAYSSKNKGNIEGQADKLYKLDTLWRNFVRLHFYPFHILYVGKFSAHMNNQIKYRELWPHKYKDMVRGRKVDGGRRTIVLKNEKPDVRKINLEQKETDTQKIISELLS